MVQTVFIMCVYTVLILIVFQDSSVFAVLVAEAVPTVCQLLGSKTLSDVLEAIQFFVTGFEFGLVSAMLGRFIYLLCIHMIHMV